jgi:catechol 2,3-dioxygenase-like lactoylglutathione lyase family enzyme
MAFVELGVSELDRSLDLYSGQLGFAPGATTVDSAGHRVAVLGSGPAVLRLVEVGPGGRPTGWTPNNRQCGIRHFGMKVADTDAWAARLAGSGVPFDMPPTDAVGGVRIAFFRDPDGACLEFVQGYVQHHNLWSAELAREEIDADRDWDGTPRFDHVAITVPDLDEALALYATRLGFGAVGQVVRPDDEHGFLITNLRAGTATLEIFSFTDPLSGVAGAGAPDLLGLRAIGLHGLPASEVAPGHIELKPGHE